MDNFTVRGLKPGDILLSPPPPFLKEAGWDKSSKKSRMARQVTTPCISNRLTANPQSYMPT